MELLEYNETLKFDGEIRFDIRECGRLYRHPKDLLILTIENLFYKNKVKTGIYLLHEPNFNWKKIVFYFSNHIKIYSGEILELMK